MESLLAFIISSMPMQFAHHAHQLQMREIAHSVSDIPSTKQIAPADHARLTSILITPALAQATSSILTIPHRLACFVKEIQPSRSVHHAFITTSTLTLLYVLNARLLTPIIVDQVLAQITISVMKFAASVSMLKQVKSAPFASGITTPMMFA